MSALVETVKNEHKDDITKKYQEVEKIINEEFKIWKKTVPLLYDTIYTHVFEWPNLTVEWSPAKPTVVGDQVIANFLIGSHTSGSVDDYLRICSISLPKTLFDSSESIEVPKTPAKKSKVSVIAQLEHPGEVNKARYNQSGSKIATLTNKGTILIFDTLTNKLKYELKYHTKEGFGLEWNPNNDDQLLSATEDNSIAFWDLSQNTTSPIKIIKTHTAVVNDLSWNSKYPTIFASCSDDKSLQIHDLRSEDETPIMKLENAHGDFDINAVEFNPELGNLIVTAGSDNLVNCYDLRNLTKPFRRLYGHTSSITQLDFNPLNPNLLLSTGLDRRVFIWDLNKLDLGEVNEQEFIKSVDYNDPVLYFVHGGFTNTISECQWSPFLEDVIIGCGEDNLLEVFKPCFHEDEEEEEEEEEGEEEEVADEEKKED